MLNKRTKPFKYSAETYELAKELFITGCSAPTNNFGIEEIAERSIDAAVIFERKFQEHETKTSKKAKEIKEILK